MLFVALVGRPASFSTSDYRDMRESTGPNIEERRLRWLTLASEAERNLAERLLAQVEKRIQSRSTRIEFHENLLIGRKIASSIQRF